MYRPSNEPPLKQTLATVGKGSRPCKNVRNVRLVFPSNAGGRDLTSEC